ncbi:hypothetical protein Cgig2_004632 [Carnegiea gigantea]|uniref:Nucleoporin NSP1-like C-terminal domain-containing protein n=1 Tax=Carnegiea gigantea TaxID=171969 RepID=A0A9Q1Q9L3_9CARY|nr:hypothetical protein Cgig2_004632 [Carnegiea gigantea]
MAKLGFHPSCRRIQQPRNPNEERKFNKDITVGLLKRELLNLAEYNIHMAKRPRLLVTGAASSSAAATSSFTGLGFSTGTSSSCTTSSFPSFTLPATKTTTPASFVTATTTTTTAANLGSLPSASASPPVSSSATAGAQTSSSLAVASSGGTTSIVTATVSAPKLPSEIMGKTVEEIIKEWSSELQELTKEFKKQANVIAEWDKRILQNRDVLLRLEVVIIRRILLANQSYSDL